MNTVYLTASQQRREVLKELNTITIGIMFFLSAPVSMTTTDRCPSAYEGCVVTAPGKS